LRGSGGYCDTAPGSDGSYGANGNAGPVNPSNGSAGTEGLAGRAGTVGSYQDGDSGSAEVVYNARMIYQKSVGDVPLPGSSYEKRFRSVLA
jgi:hypothetical protein